MSEGVDETGRGESPDDGATIVPGGGRETPGDSSRRGETPATDETPHDDGAWDPNIAPDEGATIVPGGPGDGRGGGSGSGLGGSFSGSLSDRFEIVGPLGEGGMGVVYKARDLRLGREVALKRLKADSVESHRLIDRFEREARTVAGLEHPNIVRIYSVFDDADGLVIEMELLDSGSLQQRIDMEGALAAEEVARIGVQLCEALEAAHARGIVHRDIKPANVLLTRRGTPKLADFGLAVEWSKVGDGRQTVTGSLLGTPHYAAPEQLIDGKRVDARADLYSLGATLYAAATGTSPRAIRLDRVPESIRGVLSKCLEERAEDRYQTAEAMREALQAASSGGSLDRLPAELERLIGLALSDGVLTDDERSTLVKKAESLGLDGGEFGLVLDARLHEAGVRRERSVVARLRLRRMAIGAAIAAMVVTMVLVGVQIRSAWVASARQSAESQYAAATKAAASAGEFDHPLVRGLRARVDAAMAAGSGSMAQQSHAEAESSWAEAEAQAGELRAMVSAASSAAASRVLAETALAGVVEAEHPMVRSRREALSAAMALAKSKFDGGGFEEAKQQWDGVAGQAEQLSPLAASASEAERLRRRLSTALAELRPIGEAEMQEAVTSAEAEAAAAESRYAVGEFATATETWFAVLARLESSSAVGERFRKEATLARTGFDGALRIVPAFAHPVLDARRSSLETRRRDAEEAQNAGRLREAASLWRDGEEDAKALQRLVGQAREAGRVRDAYERVDVREAAASTHPRVVEARDGAKRLADEASSQFASGEFAAATDGWTRAKERAESALALSRLAEQATAARAAFEKTNGELKPSADARLREARAEARRQADSAAMSFAKGDFDQAVSTWSAAREKLSQLNDPEIDLGNGISMRFVEIRPGRFMMGSPASEQGRGSDETQHAVTISRAFWLGQTEVTQAQWQEVMGSNPSDFKGNPNHPVEMVSWNDAQEFCRRLSERTGMTFRLPTEAEWEYACRAGTTTAFSYGDSVGLLHDYAWFGEDWTGSTKPVGMKNPNRWGLYDMHGNVWEWCSDWYGTFSSEAATDPQGPRSGTDRVLRGGSWRFAPQFCRSASRDNDAPSTCSRNIGFRILRSL